MEGKVGGLFPSPHRPNVVVLNGLFFLSSFFWANKGEEVGGEGNSPLFEVPNKLKLSEDFHSWFGF